jgi:CRP/FNR family transcriptional regulator
MGKDEIILNHPVFCSLDTPSLNQIIVLSSRKQLKKGDFLAHQGEVWPYLFLVEKGLVVAEKDSEDGKTLTAAVFSPADLFWGLAFFLEDSPMPASLRVVEESALIIWKREDMLPILTQNGGFSWELGKLAVKRMLHASEIIESMTFHPIAVRLARLLMGISNNINTSNPIERNLTLDEMAARIGSTREMVCRLLYKFSDEGLIKITRTDFTILDPQNLVQRAQL